MATPKRRRPWYQIRTQEEVASLLVSTSVQVTALAPETVAQTSKALQVAKFEQKLGRLVVEGSTIGALSKYGVVIKPEEYGFIAQRYKILSDKVFTKSWAADGINLSRRVHRDTMQLARIVATEVKAARLQSKTIMETARRLQGEISPQEIRKTFKTLERLSAFEPTAEAKARLRAAVKSARSDIARLKTAGLRQSYDRLALAIESGDKARIAKAYETAIVKKGNYVAQRIARTEMVRAENEGFAVEATNDTGAVGIKYSLSSGHNVDDICDVHTSIDLGWGAGVYPFGQTPDYPFHPNCFCNYDRVFLADGLDRDTKVSQKTIKDAGDKLYSGWSKEKRQSVLGIAKSEELAKGKDWRKLQNGFNGLGRDMSQTRFVPDDFKPSV